MAGMSHKLRELYSLEQLSSGNSPIHARHPAAKLLVTLIYLLCVMSFGRYELTALAPYLFYPALVMPLADVPVGMILKRTLPALPFALFAGLTAVLLEREPAVVIGGVTLTAGVLVCLTVLARTLLCVSAVLLLVAVTPFAELTAALRRMHVPALFVLLFEMIYRYLGILVNEASGMTLAYRLRGGGRGIRLRDVGSLIGTLFLRSMDRAERVYQAMKCRGYSLQGAGTSSGRGRRFGAADWAYLCIAGGACILLRVAHRFL